MSLRFAVKKLLRRFAKGYVTHNRIAVSQSALRHNLELFLGLSGMRVIPVLKGNAYGHRIELVAEALQGCDVPYIAVDGYFEALRVREVSKQPVLIMGAILPQNYARMHYDRFAFVVHDAESIHALGKTGKRIKVHLECNTGMNRYGAKFNELAVLTQLILQYRNLTLEGVMSHLADADSNTETTVQDAVAQFDAAVDAIRAAGARPTILHIAQSAGSLRVRSKYANAMRLGIGLYGINPFPPSHDMHARLSELRPALTLKSTITKTIELQPGEGVSYGYTFVVQKPMKIGVLPLGYYEGVPRALSNKGVVKIGEQFAPILGRVCMNHTMISLDGIDAKVGDEVVVFSNDPKDPNCIDRVAHEHDLFNYQLLTALSKDVRRVLVE